MDNFFKPENYNITPIPKFDDPYVIQDSSKSLNSKEDSIDFKDFIKLDENMTVEQAIEKLSSFHKTSSGNILKAFSDLQIASNKKDVIVTFTRSVNNSTPCISMRMTNRKNEEAFSSDKIEIFTLIDMHTGQPMQHIS
jgi:aspartate carbamoyltransferase regulatory subunit